MLSTSTISSLILIRYIAEAVLVLILLTLPVIFIYKKLLNTKHYLYSLFLLVYPILLYISGNILLAHGKKLNQEDLTARMAAGEDTHILSIDAGFSYILWGYYLWIVIVPITFLVLFLILLKLMRK